MRFDPSDIEPDYTFPVDDRVKWDLYFSLLRTTVSSLLKEYENSHTAIRALPIVKADTLSSNAKTFSVYILAHAQYTLGAGRFITDALNTYLIPGKYTPILLSRSSRFILRQAKNTPIFFIEYLIQMPESADFEILKINLPKLLRSIRLTLCCARYTRRFIQKRRISEVEKELILHENIQDLFELSNKKARTPFFDHLPKRYIEELYKKEMSEYATSLFAKEHTPFKQSIFLEVHHLISLIPLPIHQKYPQKTLIRILSFAYLFRKVISYANTELIIPHALCKLFPLQENGHHIHRWGLLLVIELPEFAIHFDQHSLFKVCQRLLPQLKKNTENSFIDSTCELRYKTIYIELNKEHFLPFAMREKQMFQQNILKEIDLYIQGLERTSERESDSIHNDLIERLQGELIEKGRYNGPLLTALIHSFSSSNILTEEWIDGLSRSYYMLYSLLDEDVAHSPFLSTAQTVEDIFIVAISTEDEKIYEKIAAILSEQRHIPSVSTLNFQFESMYFSLLYFKYDNGNALISFRSTLLDQLQRLQGEIEATFIT